MLPFSSTKAYDDELSSIYLNKLINIKKQDLNRLQYHQTFLSN